MSRAVPQRYIPKTLSRKDAKIVRHELRKSRKLYRKGKYHVRRAVGSYKRRPSKWSAILRRKYGISEDRALDLGLLSRVSRCSPKALRRIIAKGKGAYYSSGSRPNQTPTSWGRARLYSSLSGGPASRIDLHILESGCKKTSKALALARKTRRIRKPAKVKL